MLLKWLKGTNRLGVYYFDMKSTTNPMTYERARFRIKPFFAWYDFWVGVFVDRKERIIYVCPLPMLVFKIYWG